MQVKKKLMSQKHFKKERVNADKCCRKTKRGIQRGPLDLITSSAMFFPLVVTAAETCLHQKH